MDNPSTQKVVKAARAQNNHQRAEFPNDMGFPGDPFAGSSFFSACRSPRNENLILCHLLLLHHFFVLRSVREHSEAFSTEKSAVVIDDDGACNEPSGGNDSYTFCKVVSFRGL